MFFILLFFVRKQDMINFLIHGFLIGVLVSIPVGPIAILCIQRTLNKSRWHGLATGVGAAFSDMFYALIAALGMGIVISFIEYNQFIIQIIGSIVIGIFGMYLLRSNPTSTITPANTSAQNYLQDFATSFLMTISNPMIIFLFIGLFARFNFFENISLGKTIIGILAVFFGACIWWFLLVSFVNLFRNKINLRGLGIVNKITGSIIIILAVIAFIYSIIGNSFI